MAGHNLKQGDYRRENLSDDEIWSAFSTLFSNQSKNSTSYKFGFMKAILDNLYNVDEHLHLSFDQLFSKFAESYWNLVLKHHLRQSPKTVDGRMTSLERIFYQAQSDYQLPDGLPFESLRQAQMIKICHDVKMKCKENVVGALYGDTKGIFYAFDKKGEWIAFNPLVYSFVAKHKVVLEKLNYYEWAKYLEKVNEEDMEGHLLTKIDESAKRNNLSYYRNLLYQEFEETTCFYCGKPLDPDAIDVDHFVPWSFIKDDQLWNLVLACPSCNRSKSNKLASSVYLDRIEARNRELIKTIRPENKTILTRPELVSDAYYWAAENGYEPVWTVKMRRYGQGEASKGKIIV